MNWKAERSCSILNGPVQAENKALCKPASIDEVMRTIRNVKKGSAPGTDGVQYNVLKVLPPAGIRLVWGITNAVIQSGHKPADFKKGEIMPILK